MTFEQKFLVDPAVADLAAEWARKHLVPDPHGRGPWGDVYHTATLYWDTPRLDVLARRGSHGRAKYRVRRYGVAETVFLERKLRCGRRVAKRRSTVSLEELPWLLSAERGPSCWDGQWFRRRLQLRGLQPTCLLTYERLARYGGEGSATRMTIDRHLGASTVAFPDFAPAHVPVLLDDCCILELKFQDAVPRVFKSLLEEILLIPTPISKYRKAMQALGRSTTEFAGAGELS